MTAERRAIPGYEGRYSATSDGHIWTELRGKFLKPWRMPSGHCLVALHKDGRQKSLLVHRLVALAFLGESEPGTEVCHNDGDPGNNAVSNLRYGTRSENVLDQVAHGVHNNASRSHCKNGHPFDTIRADGNRRCSTCQKASALKWYYANRDLVNARAVARRAAAS